MNIMMMNIQIGTETATLTTTDTNFYRKVYTGECAGFNVKITEIYFDKGGMDDWRYVARISRNGEEYVHGFHATGPQMAVARAIGHVIPTPERLAGPETNEDLNANEELPF